LPDSPAQGYGCITFPAESEIIETAQYPMQININKKITGTRELVEGEITDDTIWEADTISVTGDIVINNGITLTIASGVMVEFQGFHNISVEGTILAEGDPENFIVFKSQNSDLFQSDSTNSGSWNGIRFHNTSSQNNASLFKYCKFENSKSLTEDVIGGVISCYNFSKLKIINSIFCNNLAIFGSVIGCDYNSSPEITGNLFYANYAILAGSPLYCKYSCPSLNNNTIVSNEILNEDVWYFTAFLHNYIAKPKLTGNILRDNLSNFFLEYQILEGKAYYTTYNNIEDGYEGIGNIDLPAYFIMEGDHPYALQDNSPCIDSGADLFPFNITIPEYDLAGRTRISGTSIDIGAYEWQSTPADDDQIEIVNFELCNFPNPFNPSTNISFVLTSDLRNTIAWQAKNAKLEIYNLKGQRVRDLSSNLYHAETEEVHGKINYSVFWNGKDDNGKSVSSGIYFCKLDITGKIDGIKKMLLLK